MIPPKRNRRWYVLLLRRTAVTVLALLLIGSALITVNESAGWLFLPSWNDIFTRVGLVDAAVSQDELRVTFLDVGNADCILIQSGEKTALIDAGEYRTSRHVLETLQFAGVERLDYVIATHADADHIGGMETLVRELEIGTFLMPATAGSEQSKTQVYESLLAALEDQGVPMADADYGFTCCIGKAQLKIISGRQTVFGGNEGSAVCRLNFGEHTFLFMGDSGKTVERHLLLEGEDIEADVIKIGHHGSNTATDPQFIRLSRPAYAVITCGIDNAMGYPHEETLKTLEEYGVAVYRSDHHGDIVFRSDGTTLSVTTER